MRQRNNYNVIGNALPAVSGGTTGRFFSIADAQQLTSTGLYGKPGTYEVEYLIIAGGGAVAVQEAPEAEQVDIGPVH